MKISNPRNYRERLGVGSYKTAYVHVDVTRGYFAPLQKTRTGILYRPYLSLWWRLEGTDEYLSLKNEAMVNEYVRDQNKEGRET